ncbi:hypothetical protein [Fodinibius sp.]|uniref:hypothetical protein n=1 Tax=Fodinibius sp. TaxID=1872440 RepID=UPI002ACD2260|nr:hypothetical protein [Fodinibius sp.]MDZ7658835.1 hypothetical protein [Fodinibius sp.]
MGRSRDYTIQNWQITVGNSTQPVSVDDMYLWNRIHHGGGAGQLEHGNRQCWCAREPIQPTSRFTDF